MPDRMELMVVNKILGLRSKYNKLRSPDNADHFYSLCDQVLKELDEFKELTGYAIDIGIISCSDTDFEIYQNTGTIREYIIHDKGHL